MQWQLQHNLSQAISSEQTGWMQIWLLTNTNQPFPLARGSLQSNHAILHKFSMHFPHPTDWWGDWPHFLSARLQDWSAQTVVPTPARTLWERDVSDVSTSKRGAGIRVMMFWWGVACQAPGAASSKRAWMHKASEHTCIINPLPCGTCSSSTTAQAPTLSACCKHIARAKAMSSGIRAWTLEAGNEDW